MAYAPIFRDFRNTSPACPSKRAGKAYLSIQMSAFLGAQRHTEYVCKLTRRLILKGICDWKGVMQKSSQNHISTFPTTLMLKKAARTKRWQLKTFESKISVLLLTLRPFSRSLQPKNDSTMVEGSIIQTYTYCRIMPFRIMKIPQNLKRSCLIWQKKRSWKRGPFDGPKVSTN